MTINTDKITKLCVYECNFIKKKQKAEDKSK